LIVGEAKRFEVRRKPETGLEVESKDSMLGGSWKSAPGASRKV